MNNEQTQQVPIVTEETKILPNEKFVPVMPKPERFKRDPFPIPEKNDVK